MGADLPETPQDWILADLGELRAVGGLTLAIGDYPADFPRRLVIDLSADGQTWNRAFDGPTFSQAFLGFVRDLRWSTLRFPFDARQARYVRLRETARPTNFRVQDSTYMRRFSRDEN